MVSYRYYDDLRKDSPENFVPIFNNTPYVGRNLHRYNDGSSAGPELLCHTPLFVRYTRRGEEYSAGGYGSSAGTMMAIHHWNNGNGVVVKEIQDIQQKCPIRFTTEIFDTETNPIPAVKGLTDMMIRDPNNPATPQPCAIVGTYYSAVSTKFAITSGVYDLLQVAPGASSDVLDDKKQYPLFTRTHPADSGSAMLLPKYFKEVMKVENFAIVYVDGDGFGASYLKVLQEYASNNEMNTIAVPVGDPTLPSTSTEDIMEDLNIILENELNYVIGIFFFDSYKPIMKAAAELGVAGPGKFWFFAGT
jgi:ABC-type branched-subunit amino acid transport system substrate-binding protein